MAKTVVGLFDNFSEAEAAVRDLQSAGFDHDDISIVRGNTTTSGSSTTTSDAGDAAGGALAGAGTGAVVGGIGAALATLLIPGVGAALGMGWLAAAAAGGAVGAAAGGLIGGLTAVGVPEDEARHYEEGVRRGGTLVTLRAEDNRADAAIAIFNRHNPVDIETRGAEWRKAGWTYGQATPAAAATKTTATAATTRPVAAAARATENVQGEKTLPVIEEELQVGKREVQTGGIRVYSRMTETPVEEQVKLREEHVRVERRPVDRVVSPADVKAFQDATIEVTERAEVAVVKKEARVVEEVVVGKEATERTETVRDTVRRTDVEVERVGAETTRAVDYDAYDKDFRQNFQTTFRGGDYSYDQAKPAYRYGVELAGSSRGEWTSVESDARRRWEERNPGTWEKVKDAARYAYDRARSKVNS